MSRWRTIVSWFNGMSVREKGLIIGCLLLFGGIIVARGLVFPVYAKHKKNIAAIRQRASTIERYEEIRKSSDQVDEKLRWMKRQAEEREAGLLRGRGASEAGIVLQELLKPLVRKPSTRLTAIRSLSPVKKGAYTEIAVQLDMHVGTIELAQILADIARQPKYLKVRKLYANTGLYPGRPLQGKETINVSMVVVGMSGAPMDDAKVFEGGNP